MTRTLVIGHAGLAEAMIRAAREIIGIDTGCAAFDVRHDRSIEDIEQDLESWIERECARGPAIALVDLPGATPHNMTVRVARRMGVPVVTGASLPMLLRALNHAEVDPLRLARLAEEGGLRAITVETVS